jgi:hypothetical protein
VIIPGIIASSRPVVSGAFQSMSTVTVGSGGAATVTFSSIPSNFQHLQFRIHARSTIAGTSSDNIAFRINGDTGSNYSTHSLYGTGDGSAYAAAFAGLSYAYFPSTIASSGNLSNVFAGVIADFHNYGNTNMNKTIRVFSGYDENANSGGIYENRVQLSSAFWNSTTAMTSVVFQTSANFAEGTVFSLYGITGA